jgi:hypothetical protein
MIKIPGSKSPKALASRRVRKTTGQKKRRIREETTIGDFLKRGKERY